jgi:hypothetical protein
VDLSRIHSVIAVVNANVDDSNAGRNTAMGIGGSWGQTTGAGARNAKIWDMAGIHFRVAVRPVGSTTSGPARISAFHQRRDFPWSGQLALPPSSPKPWSAGHARSFDQRGLQAGNGEGRVPGQNLWKRCQECQALAYSGNASPGTCLRDGTHDYSKSADYTLVALSSNLNATFNAHETGRRYGLARSWSANPDVEYGNLETSCPPCACGRSITKITRRLNSPTLYKLLSDGAHSDSQPCAPTTPEAKTIGVSVRSARDWPTPATRYVQPAERMTIPTAPTTVRP